MTFQAPWKVQRTIKNACKSQSLICCMQLMASRYPKKQQSCFLTLFARNLYSVLVFSSASTASQMVLGCSWCLPSLWKCPSSFSYPTCGNLNGPKARMDTLCLVLSLQCNASCAPLQPLSLAWLNSHPSSLPSFSGGRRHKHICKGQKSFFRSQAPRQCLFASESTRL